MRCYGGDPCPRCGSTERASTLGLELLARRVYELHGSRVPWDALPEPRRSELIVAYWRAKSSYEVGRRAPREVRIE